MDFIRGIGFGVGFCMFAFGLAYQLPPVLVAGLVLEVITLFPRLLRS